MKLRKIMSLAIVATIVMTGISVVSAETDDAAFTETFDDYTLNDSYGNTLSAMMSNGWYYVNENTVFTDTGADPYTAFTKGLEVVEHDGRKCLQLDTPNLNKNYNNFGIGRYFPGESKTVSGVWEINFKFRSYYSGTSKVQFNFSMNTADGSAASATAAQHNIASAYGNKMYIGYRNYMTLYSNGITQGTVSDGIQPTWWYDVKAVVNCDAKYYSVEVRHNGDLVARRSPISFDGDETIGFLKLSALGMGNPHRIWVDDISIAKTTREDLIYEEDFNAYTLTTQASVGMTTGEGPEVVTGDSYFKYNTPWRYNSSIGKSYEWENDETLSSQVVRLGDLSSTPDEIDASGLVYMQAGENIVTQATEKARGNFKVSFKIKPETIADAVTVNVAPNVSYDITDSACEMFKIVNQEGAPKLVKTNSELISLNASKWYNVELLFDVTKRTVKTVVTDIATSESVSFTREGEKTPNAVKGIMFKVAGGSSVLMDDIKLEYYMPYSNLTELVRINSVKAGDETVKSISDITAGSNLDVACEYAGSSEEIISFTAVLLFYGNGKLVDMQMSDAAVQSDAGETIVSFTVPSSLDMSGIDKMSIFAWDGLENMTPLAHRIDY